MHSIGFTWTSEINWVVKCVLAGYSNRYDMDLIKFLQEFFQTVTLPKSLNLLDKNQCILQSKTSHLTSSRCCNRNMQNQAFDESLNSITRSCEMDVVLRYWSDENKKVKVRYFMLKLEIKKDLFGCHFFYFQGLNFLEMKKTVSIIRYFFSRVLFI